MGLQHTYEGEYTTLLTGHVHGFHLALTTSAQR